MELNLKTTEVFLKNYQAYQNKKYRIIANQGGRGSSKTWSLAQLFLLILITQRNVLLTVCRKTFPALRATAYRDFLEITRSLGLYRQEWHNRSEHFFKWMPNNSEIEFISIDEPMKVRGRKRQYLWMNETLEFDLEDYKQLLIRTEKKIFMDFNPSAEWHWIYDEVLPRADCFLIKSTYKDNPFLNKMIVYEIERLKSLDQNYWRIYGLGERAISETIIYKHWQWCDALPRDGEIIYGLDFGYNNPTALTKVCIKDNAFYCQEMLYQSYLTNQQLIERLKSLISPADAYIYADSAEPQRIEEIKQAGFNIRPALKDIKKGIDIIKSHALYITKDSVNILKEIKSYSFKEKNGLALDEPIKFADHAMDSIRYACHSHLFRPTPEIRFL